jgi:hypothetical protein
MADFDSLIRSPAILIISVLESPETVRNLPSKSGFGAAWLTEGA